MLRQSSSRPIWACTGCGAYYITALRNSIVSLGQLDEGGSKVEINKSHEDLGSVRPTSSHQGPVRREAPLCFPSRDGSASLHHFTARKDDEAWR